MAEEPEHTDTQRRGRVALSDTPSGYRVITQRVTAPPSVLMEVELFQFTANRSLKKCPNNCKNQERIYVEGDIVGVIMNFDPFTYKGDVWFVVAKPKKQNQRRLWKRSWLELQENFGSNLPAISVGYFEVCELGKVSVAARNGRGVPTRETGCLSIKIDDGIYLWVEVGMFKIRTLPQNFYFTKLCFDYAHHPLEIQSARQGFDQGDPRAVGDGGCYADGQNPNGEMSEVGRKPRKKKKRITDQQFNL